MTFSEILRRLMKNGNITPYRLSKDLNVHQTTIKNWLDGQTPGPENIQKIANRFHVSIDFMLGLEDLMTCKDCGLLYDPLDAGDSEDHNEFHQKKLNAMHKFGELYDYKERELIKRKTKRILEDSTIPADFKIDFCIPYFKSYFSESIEINQFDLNHVSFHTYLSMLLFQKHWKQYLGDPLYHLMVSKYGKQPGITEGEFYYNATAKQAQGEQHKLQSISILEQSDITADQDRQIGDFISYLLSKKKQDSPPNEN
ncbi:helix-turn-helix domain-containing protein [Sinanaerobacter sp. ZZT-01]|uniref:helix-turn-helix domain-containing protein n=1 Tax=Sinanaerobacter sp. ZZT-01 TaxID=3111540 RepID=UPI002D7989E3|nr:helix-turn-helix domain-containing protein [Sinanaerobacter sp. ZZT-01]WRR94097.1 helix-turn-helix domain-containing protein [Sinanaerobacter sp. ZZT-01]